MAREKKWREMPSLVTDEMLAAFAVETAPDEVGSALKERYEGLIDRVSLYRSRHRSACRKRGEVRSGNFSKLLRRGVGLLQGLHEAGIR